MIKIKEISMYYNEWNNNKKLIENLFWFQKHKGLKWIFGQNFGDYLSTIIVAEVAKEKKFDEMILKDKKLLAIGSILHFARNKDIVWGSGINGKVDEKHHSFTTLDIRSMRGPLTKDFLEKRNIKTNEIFGDPAILIPYLFPKYKYQPIKNKIIAIPNLNEYLKCKKTIPKYIKLVSPMQHWLAVLKEILSSELVITSSLHGLILSEAYNVPVKLFKPFGGETMFKYEDYLEGTGRKLSTTPKSLEEKFDINNGVSFSTPKVEIQKLLNAFPSDLFKNKRK